MREQARLHKRGKAWRRGCAVAALPLAALALVFVLAGGPAPAQAAGAAAEAMPERRPGPSTGLPVPRFVSLKSSKANVRRGPGSDFPIDWVYRKSGLPLEVIAESNNWRRVRDHEGDGGWIWHTMLAGERSVIVDAAENDGGPVALRSAPRGDAAVVAYAEKGYIARLKSCRARWCRLDIRGLEGWIAQDQLWGVYAGEEFD
ncbi:MAG: hypothetical protein KF765_02970 [Parvibaculaceae bacterium]|nr:hypothetical protein [Parvibaculaceae bacterium]